MPNLSISIPNRCAQKVGAMGIMIFPASPSWEKIRSASAGSSTMMLTEKPCGLEKNCGGASAPHEKAISDL